MPTIVRKHDLKTRKRYREGRDDNLYENKKLWEQLKLKFRTKRKACFKIIIDAGDLKVQCAYSPGLFCHMLKFFPRRGLHLNIWTFHSTVLHGSSSFWKPHRASGKGK